MGIQMEKKTEIDMETWFLVLVRTDFMCTTV